MTNEECPKKSNEQNRIDARAVLRRYDGWIITNEVLEACKSERGGYTKDFFDAIGEGRNPSRGWKERALGRILRAPGLTKRDARRQTIMFQ